MKCETNRRPAKRILACIVSMALVLTLVPLSGQQVYAASKKMALSPKTISLTIGAAKTIKVKNAPKRAKLTYKSANKSIAAVTKKGKVQGLKAGKTSITVLVKKGKTKKKLTCRVTVQKPVLSKTKLTLEQGKAYTISIKNKPHKNAGAVYTWSSSDETVAAVKNGKVTGLTAGTAEISLKIRTKTKAAYNFKAYVTVKRAPLPITLDQETITLNKGESKKLTASILPEHTTEQTVSWSSLDKEVATVEDGLVTGKGLGTTVIEARTIKGAVASCTVNVGLEEEEAFDDFAKAAAEFVKADDQNENNEDMQDEYYTKRLIVKGGDTGLNLTECSPEAVIKGSDDIYILQFATREATIAAEKNLKSSEAAWVETDSYSNYPDGEVEEDDSQEPADNGDNTENAAHKSWGVSRIGADRYAASLKGKKGSVTVAVVDTGVSSHSFLSGRLLSGYDFVDLDKNPSDPKGHGTHVAGTIVDCTPGLSVKILPIRVLGINGGTSINVGNGIRYAADHKASVINLSLGGGHSNYKDEAIAYAIRKGVTVVVSAGNDNKNTSAYCPAHITGAVVVAATDKNDKKASFSNYGNSVDVAAPGVSIVSSVPGGKYQSYSGTSMAAPHVSAVAAMFKLDTPSFTPAKVESKIKKHTRDLGSKGWDKYYGYGIPDIRNLKTIQPTGIKLNKTAATVYTGDSVTLTAVVSPESATDKSVIWSSSNAKIASVSNGKVTGVSKGTATITAKTSNGKTASCKITVKAKNIEVTGITMSKAEAELYTGESITLTAAVSPESATDKSVTWSSSNAKVATVSNGKVTGVSKGTATIAARTSNGKNASCKVTVKDKIIEVTGITLDKTEANLYTGESVTLTATVSPSNATDKSVTWSSSNARVATVSSGRVTGVSAGTATVTARTANGKTASCQITVQSKNVEVTKITLNRTSATLYAGDTLALTATVSPENASNRTITWSSDNPSIASVDRAGTVTAVSKGAATITAAASNGIQAACRIQVNQITEIRTLQQLKDVKSDLSGHYRLMQDIDLGNVEWEPIGSDRDHMFKGIFDGNGHTISGLNITAPRTNYNGLFGYLNGTVKNLAVQGRIAFVRTNISSHSYAGGISGYGTEAVITDCTSRVTIDIETNNDSQGSYTEAGGIIGLADQWSQMKNCRNYGDIHGASRKGVRTDAYSGGIAGTISNGAAISGCTNEGRISAYTLLGESEYFTICYAGGIAGRAAVNVNVTSCTNSGSIRAESYPQFATQLSNSVSAGGIIGTLNSGSISGCMNHSGSITALGSEHTVIGKGDITGKEF
ncbi:MAG: S8 family serine peptidase [Firmicutes bacterium]|nr:S8 family serine peptidase [Bacillota bacterium]